MYVDDRCLGRRDDFADDGFADQDVVDMIVAGTYCLDLAACISDDAHHSSRLVVLVDFQRCTLKSDCGRKLGIRVIVKGMECRWHRGLGHY